jgi:hypothetical protein
MSMWILLFTVVTLICIYEYLYPYDIQCMSVSYCTVLYYIAVYSIVLYSIV